MKPAPRSARTCAIGAMSASSRPGATASTRRLRRFSNGMAGGRRRLTPFPTGSRNCRRLSRTAGGNAGTRRRDRNRTPASQRSRGMASTRSSAAAREARPFVLSVKTGATAFAATWRAPLSTRRELGRRRIRWARAACPPTARRNFADRIAYGIPDILGRDRNIYAGVTTLVIGSGHSAGNALLDLVRLARNRAAHVDRLGDAGHRSRAHFQRRRCRPAAGARRTRRKCKGVGR